MAVLKGWRKKKALIAVSVAIIQLRKQRRRRSVVRDCWRKPWNTRRFDQGCEITKHKLFVYFVFLIKGLSISLSIYLSTSFVGR